MGKYKSEMGVAAVFTALGLIGMFMNPDRAGAQGGPPGRPSTPVAIISPLPLPVTGSISGTVDVAGTVSVNNTVNVAGTVGVNNTVDVAGTVDVSNIVSVKNIDERGRNPYFVSLFCQNSSGSNCDASAPAIPNGMRLVIEHVNATIQVRNPGIVQRFDVYVGNSDLGQLPAQLVNNDGSFTNFVINEPTLLFVEAGKAPKIVFNATDAAVSVTGRLSGYLVDLSQ